MKMFHKTIAGLIVGAGLAAGSISVSAAPLTSAPGLATSNHVTAPAVENVRYYGRGGHYRRHHRGPSIYFGFGPRWGYRNHWRHRGW